MKNRILKIPKSFKIFAHTIKIQYNDRLIEKENCTGQASVRRGTIILQPNNKIVNRPREQLELTFLHEVIHMVFEYLVEEELRDNEKLVELLASVLLQIYKTAEY